MCASILNRLSARERAGIRTLQDELNDRTYEEAAVSGIEFVSPAAIWDGHEPCGASGQYTNAVKPYLNFPDPVNGGSFHPNAAGQQTLAALLACYLDAYHQPPDPFAPGAPHIHAAPAQLVTPAQLHMVPAPGLDSVPGSGTIPAADTHRQRRPAPPSHVHACNEEGRWRLAQTDRRRLSWTQSKPGMLA